VAALFHKRRLTVAHVGDSRLYVCRGGSLRQITNDHSLVAEQVAQGLLTPEQAETSDIQNVLTRALGVRPEVEVDVSEPLLESGDCVLLCSDGLSRMVKDDVIARELDSRKEPAEMCHNLVRLALERGGKDNVTVAVGRVTGGKWWSHLFRWKTRSQ
jgi:protein phosphatase